MVLGITLDHKREFKYKCDIWLSNRAHSVLGAKSNEARNGIAANINLLDILL